VQPDPDQVSSFAAVRGHDHVMTIMVINKQLDQSADATIVVNHFAVHGNAETWQLANNAITHLHDTGYTDGRLQLTLPPASVTLFVLRNMAQP